MLPSDKMSVADVLKVRNAQWWEIPQLVDAASNQHNKNLAQVKKAIEHYNKKGRPLEILVIHGSSRSNYEKSAAGETSNSQMLLEYGLEGIESDRIHITRIHLRDAEVSPCEGCVSTASALCGFPCNCFPFDPMQQYYPMVLKSDIMLFSTPVNQSAMSSRLKLFCDRLISLDGGFLVDVDQYQPKDQVWRDIAIEISKSGDIEYASRMQGRVCAYFISSKDQNNPNDENFDYGKEVARSLWKGYDDYGCLHPEPYFVVAAADPDVDYSYDKEHLTDNESVQAKSKRLVKSTIELALELKKKPIKVETGRINRT